MSDKAYNRKIGTIILAVAAIENSWPDLCKTLFTRFCPFRADLSPDGTRIAYTGFSHDFDEVPEGEKPPRYTMSCARNNGIVAKIVFNKVIPNPAPAPAEDKKG